MIRMKRYDDGTKSAAFAGAKKIIRRGVAAILLPVFIGCATAPKPVTIRHEGASSLSDLALSERKRREPVDERVAAALLDLQHRKESSDQRTAALLFLLKSKNMISDEEAALITGETTTGASGEQGADVAREVNISAEEIKEEIRSEVTNELLRQVWTINNVLKEKDKRLRFGGDVRLRYEQVRFDENNFNEFTKISAQGTDTQELQNTWVNHERLKYRVRFGAEALVNEEVDAVIRLSTGSTSNPVSTNTTMGDHMNKDGVLFDLAYIKWQPWKALTLYAGRMPNPWFSTDLVWDSDLNFEGLALKATGPVGASWNTFLTGGAFPLQQAEGTLDFSQHGKWLYAGQAGVERKNKKGISAKVGAAYYSFKNIAGERNDDPGYPGATDWSAALYTQRGNSLFYIDSAANNYKVGLASEFKELNATAILDIGFWDPVHVVFLVDYVKNIGFKKGDVIGRVAPGTDYDPPKEVEGHQLGMAVGYPAIQEGKQWKLYLYEKRLGKDAVVDAFTDSDFHLGGTNAKGWILGTDLGLAKNFWLALRWLAADEFRQQPLSIDVLQVDINARF